MKKIYREYTGENSYRIYVMNYKYYYNRLNEVVKGQCGGDRREGDQWGDLDVDGRIILGWISRKWDVGIWTGLGWPRIETGGGRL